MAIDQRLKNLGYPTTHRTINYAALVRQQWGEEWDQPVECYQFSNGRTFLDTDRGITGVYGTILNDYLIEDGIDPQDPNTYDVETQIFTEEGIQIIPSK